MKLTDVTRRISSQHKVAAKRCKETGDESLRQFGRGYLQALEELSDYIKRGQDIERMEQRMEKLKTEQLEEPEPDWSGASEEAQKDTPSPANNNTETGPFAKVTSAHQAA